MVAFGSALDQLLGRELTEQAARTEARQRQKTRCMHEREH